VQYLESGQKNINGWKVGSLFGDSAFYNGDCSSEPPPPRQVSTARCCRGHVSMTKTLANGEPLDGSKHHYTLTFPAGSSRQ